jgi:hypothetical protein
MLFLLFPLSVLYKEQGVSLDNYSQLSLPQGAKPQDSGHELAPCLWLQHSFPSHSTNFGLG